MVLHRVDHSSGTVAVMRTVGVLACLAAAACGRIGFEGGPSDAGVSDDGATATPLVWLRMDDAPGSTTLFDASGHGHHATCAGGTCPTLGVPGARGTAARFDGIDDLALIAYASAFDLQAMTISARVNIEAQGADFVEIAARQYGTEEQDVWIFGVLSPTTDPNRPYQWAVNTQNGVRSTYGTPSGPDLGTWVHVAATYDGTTLRLYRDGAEISTLSAPGPVRSDTTPIVVGAANNGMPMFVEHLTGSIDDLKIFAPALAPADVAAL